VIPCPQHRPSASCRHHHQSLPPHTFIVDDPQPPPQHITQHKRPCNATSPAPASERTPSRCHVAASDVAIRRQTMSFGWKSVGKVCWTERSNQKCPDKHRKIIRKLLYSKGRKKSILVTQSPMESTRKSSGSVKTSVTTTFGSGVTLTTVLAILFSLTENSDLLNLHIRQQHPTESRENKVQTSGWIIALVNALSDKLGKNQTSSLFFNYEYSESLWEEDEKC